MLDFDEWFEKFWFTYPGDFCNNKGAKPKAKKAAQKILKDSGEAELKRIFDKLSALIRYDKRCKEKGEKVYIWPMVSSWLNGGYYDREIPSYTEKQKIDRKCQCGELASVGSLCLKCFNKGADWKRMHYENLKSMGLGKYPDETMKQYANRCREYMRKQYPDTFKLVGG